MGQLVGAAVQLVVGQAALFEDDRDPFGSALDLLLDEGVQRAICGIRNVRGIPLAEELQPLAHRHQGQRESCWSGSATIASSTWWK